MHVTKISDTQVSIAGCIISYPHLHEARAANPTSAPKFSANIILPSTMDQADWDILNGMAAHVLAAKWPQGAPADCRSPFKNAGDKIPQYAGHYALNCSAAADRPPQVVRENPRELASPGEVYPGCGVNVFLGAYAYDASGNKGVSFGLNAVQIADRTTPRLDSGKAAHDVFGVVQAPAATGAAVGVAPGPGAPAGPAPAGPVADASMPPALNPAPHQPSPNTPAPSAPVGVPGPQGPGPGGPGPAVA